MRDADMDDSGDGSEWFYGEDKMYVVCVPVCTFTDHFTKTYVSR